MSAVLSALSHPARRRVLDIVGAAPGCTIGEVSARFETSRMAVSKHIAVLKRAGLVVARREGRMRCLYRNAMPLQLIYDRWTSRWSAPLARTVADIKYAAEAPDES